MTENEVTTIRQGDYKIVSTQAVSPSQQIIQMLEHGLDTGKIEKMLELQERWEANEARKVFYADMSNAQAEMPMVAEDKYNSQTSSNYSSYKALAATCKPIYTKHGLSLIFYEVDCPKEGYVRVCVDVAHRMGHKETFHADIPDDIAGIAGKVNKTKPHAKGSSFSYGRSYLMKLVFNLPTGDDDDGNGAGNEFITPEQASAINKLVVEAGADINRFLVFAKAETIDTIAETDFKRVVNELHRAIAIAKKTAQKKAKTPKDAAREPGSDDE